MSPTATTTINAPVASMPEGLEQRRSLSRRQAPNEVPHAYTGDVRSRHLDVITFQGRGGARLL